MTNLSCHQLPLEVHVEEVASRLGVRFRPTIGRAYVGGDLGRRVFCTRFNVVVFWGFAVVEVESFLHSFHRDAHREWPSQDYPLRTQPDAVDVFYVDNDVITLRELSEPLLDIACLALSQSVGLERHELALEKRLPQIRSMMESIGRFTIFDRKRLLGMLADLARQRHDIIGEMYLLDKPEITWENETLEKLYNAMACQLELRERFQVLEYKLRLVKEEVDVLLDFVNQKTSEFLEWIIIVLIALEIFFWLYEQVFRG